jgi:serine/threonine protein kinase
MNEEGVFSDALPPGTRIGPAVLEKPIAQGAWGIVYEGLHADFGRVAIKEYFPSTYVCRRKHGNLTASAPQWKEAVKRGLEQFAADGSALKSIRREHVVAVHDYIEEHGSALLVMEFLEGGTLTQALEAGKFRDAEAVIRLGEALVDALREIHAENLLHCNVAPDNIMIRSDGSPVLIDFGGAAAAIASATRSTQNVIKEGYSAPEQYDAPEEPARPIGPWSDIYATAAVLYRLASGQNPTDAHVRFLAAGMEKGIDPLAPLKALAPKGYPREWLSAVDVALALVPMNRPQNADAWRRRFEETVKKAGSIPGASVTDESESEVALCPSCFSQVSRASSVCSVCGCNLHSSLPN